MAPSPVTVSRPAGDFAVYGMWTAVERKGVFHVVVVQCAVAEPADPWRDHEASTIGFIAAAFFVCHHLFEAHCYISK